jgi:hypothetical protein
MCSKGPCHARGNDVGFRLRASEVKPLRRAVRNPAFAGIPVELHMEYAHYFDFFGCVTSSLAKVSH